MWSCRPMGWSWARPWPTTPGDRRWEPGRCPPRARRADRADAGDGIQLGHLVGNRGEQLLDPAGQLVGLGADRVDTAGQHRQQGAVVDTDVPDARLGQAAELSGRLPFSILPHHTVARFHGSTRTPAILVRQLTGLLGSSESVPPP